VLFLDADDIIEPGHVASLIDALDGSQRHLAMGQWDRFRENIAEATFPARTNYRSAGPADWLSADWVGGAPMAQCGQFLIPRALLDQAGGWDEELSLIDDLEFFARLICASEGIRFTPHAKLYYRTGIAGSLSGQTSRKAAESAVRSLLLGTGHLLAVEDSARTRRACANILRTFDHTFYPRYADLRGIVERRVAELGGSDLTPVGPPRFHALRRWIGWRAARRIQHFWERLTA
jgi:hypothetical protein